MRVKRDNHGLFLCLNGNIYRPEYSELTDGAGAVGLGKTVLCENQEVRARRIGKTPFAAVTGFQVEEFWCLHGQSLDQSLRIGEAWRPSRDVVGFSEMGKSLRYERTGDRQGACSFQELVGDRMADMRRFLSGAYGMFSKVERVAMLIADAMRYATQMGLDAKTMLKVGEGYYDAETIVPVR